MSHRSGSFADENGDFVVDGLPDLAEFIRFNQRREQKSRASDQNPLHMDIGQSLSGELCSVETTLDKIMINVQVCRADAALQQLVGKAKRMWQVLYDPSYRPQNVVFMFKDGPVSRAAKLARKVVLEDFDLPSQAVTERMNSILEPNPTLSVTEDITVARVASTGLSNTEVEVMPGFGIIATINHVSGHRLRISPAARSRFTEVRWCGEGLYIYRFLVGNLWMSDRYAWSPTRTRNYA